MALTIKSKEVIKYREEEHKVPLVLYEIIVDIIGELPTNPIVEDEEIAQGSIAWVVETGEFYGYTSTGSWINQKDGGAAPVLIEKTITENGTYNASSDNADGYSSVTVNVPSGGLDNPTYFKIRKTSKSGPFSPSTFTENQDIVELYQSDNGIVTIPKQVYLEERQSIFTGVIIVLGDVNRINIEPLNSISGRRMIFKAGSDFDGLYINDTKITISDTITAGLWYTLYVENNNGSYDVLIDEQYPTSGYTDSGVIPIS